jgi:multisubunit Na+/H+ antiporter MnhB subunit
MSAIFRALAPFVNFALKVVAILFGFDWLKKEFTPQDAEEEPLTSIAAVMGLVFGILFVTQAFGGKAPGRRGR